MTRKRSEYYVDTILGKKKTIYAKRDYYDWNPVYHTYNSRKGNELLKWSDLGIRSTRRKRR